MAPSDISIGLVQAPYGVDVGENYELTRTILMRSYAGADLVVLPEYSMLNVLGGLEPGRVYERAEAIEDSWYLSKLGDLAGRLGVDILAYLTEKTSKPPLVYGTSVLVKSSGGVEPVYRKIHLFDAYGFRESNYLLPGEHPSRELLVNGWRLRAAICFDIRFPELFTYYALSGADLVVVQAGWVRGPLKEESLLFLARSRAHENTVYVAVANQNGRQYTGRSSIHGPLGTTLMDMGGYTGYSEKTLSREILEEARRSLPILELRRRNAWLPGRWDQSLSFIKQGADKENI